MPSDGVCARIRHYDQVISLSSSARHSQCLAMFLRGHTLRGVEDSPAYLSILFAINAETDTNFKGRRGTPSLNLLDMIRNDLKRKIFQSL